MIQIALTNIERTRALQHLGYSEREACFLCRVALHGGYFVRRQCAAFLGNQDGGTVTQLVEKILDKGHAEAGTYRANTHVYHLFARPFYAALGQEDNRNRRRKEVTTIKAKLMGLDFVQAHPDHDYLTTEQEKIEFFEKSFGIGRESLPTKRYASRGRITDRYFVEKYPIFYSPSQVAACPPVVSCCFVDPGMATVSGFETFLDQYARLFAHLREFRVIYLAATEALFSKASVAFDQFAEAKTGASGAILDPRTSKILEYFETRRLYETKQLASFDRAKLIRLRDQQREFARPEIETLYQRWTTVGRAIFVGNSAGKQPIEAHSSGQFSTYRLEHSYDLFGNLTTY